MFRKLYSFRVQTILDKDLNYIVKKRLYYVNKNLY